MSSRDPRYPLRLLCCLALPIALVGCASGPGGKMRSDQQAGLELLASCPSRPSCVVSRDDAGGHSVEALRFEGSTADAIARIRDVLQEMPRTQIVKESENYLHATQQSGGVGFTDDIEFLVGARTGRIDVRSCSRAGYFDFGVNRARVESIRDALGKLQ